MRDHVAIAMLGALAQEHRLRIFRLLVSAGAPGLPSSEIAIRIGISPTSASFHLKELQRTGLISAARQGRFIVYGLEAKAMRQLLGYLTDECCQGHPELCGAVFKGSSTKKKAKASCP